MSVKTLIIVRHGDTFAPGDVVRRIGSRTDLPLVASGLVQARVCGRWLAKECHEVARVLCGPLMRTVQTAEHMMASAGMAGPPQTVDWLNEIDHGPDEGRSESDVVARLGAEALHRWDRQGLVPAGWPVDPKQRVAQWRAGAASLPPGVSVLVTSNGMARFAVPALAPEAPVDDRKLRTGSLGEIILSPSGAAVTRWNFRPSTALV